jgi:predicted DNA-binding transcriptional regulator YafY
MLHAGFHLPPLMFSPEEMEALVTGARLVKAWAGNKLADAAEQALVKIEHALPPKLKERIGDTRLFAPGFHAYAQHVPQLDNLRDAINTRQALEIGYVREDGAQSTRCIRPLGLFFWGNVWTLAAWCEAREDYRNFRVDRIQALTPLDRKFEETKEISLETLFARYRARAEAGAD